MVANRPAAVWLTKEGMKLVGIRGEATRPRLAEFHHDLYVVELAQKLVAERPDTELVTERELRREDTPGGAANFDPQYAVQRRNSNAVILGGNRRVYPDLVTVRKTNGHHLIHEVEHTPKDVRRLVSLMTSYQESENVDGIRYYAFDAALDRLERARSIAVERSVSRGNRTPIQIVRWDDFMSTEKEERL